MCEGHLLTCPVHFLNDTSRRHSRSGVATGWWDVATRLKPFVSPPARAAVTAGDFCSCRPCPAVPVAYTGSREGYISRSSVGHQGAHGLVNVRRSSVCYRGW